MVEVQWNLDTVPFHEKFLSLWPIFQQAEVYENSGKFSAREESTVPKVLYKPHYGNPHLEMAVWK